MTMNVNDAIKAGAAAVGKISNAERVTYGPGVKKKIIEELRKATDHERVRDEPHILAAYRGPSFTVFSKFMAKSLPDMVVFPESREEVQEVLKIASKYKVPVAVICGQAGVGGNVCYQGGILIELTKMNKIHKIDTEHDYVVVEPGVTVSQLMERIRPQGYAVAKGSYPSSFSVLSTTVTWLGQHHFVTRNWNNAIGFEMVTPDGSIINTGSKVYGDCGLWTEVQSSFPCLKDLFQTSYATTGVVTKAAIRIYPMLDKQAFPLVGFDDFESAFRWTHAMSKSPMVDTTMVWGWAVAAQLEYKQTERYLDYIEATLNCYNDETPKEIDMFNCFGWAMMRGYKDEIGGGIKTAKRFAKQFGGTFISEDELRQRWPNLWKSWVGHYSRFITGEHEWGIGPEEVDFTTQWFGPVDEIIKLYKGLSKKSEEFNYKNWPYYTRQFQGGRAPFFRFFPRVEGTTAEEVGESLQLRDALYKHSMEKYDVTINKDDFCLSDPENPENFKDRAKPIKRIMTAIQKEFDPENIMNPLMKKYTLF